MIKIRGEKGYSLKFQGFARITQYAKKAKNLLFNYQSRVQLTPFTTFCLIYKKASHAYIGKKTADMSAILLASKRILWKGVFSLMS